MNSFKVIFLFTSVLFYNTLTATEIKIEEHYKILGTFSGNIKGDSTFHLIIAKNKKTKAFDILPLTYINQKVTRLGAISFVERPSVLSYHVNGDMITLLLNIKVNLETKICIIDFNKTTGETGVKTFTSSKGFKTNLREGNRNLLFFTNKEDSFIIKSIVNASSIKTDTIVKNDNNRSILHKINKNPIDAINTNEFVRKGSINNYKVYCFDDEITLTKEDFNKKETLLIRKKLNSLKPVSEVKSFGYENFSAVRNAENYVYKNKFYQILLNKKVGFINVFNITTNKRTSISLNEDIIANKGNDFEGLINFLKKATKNAYKPTITINQGDNDNLILRCDYTSRQSRYNHNWWWHHQWQQQMMFHQQNVMRSINSFGPHLPFEDFYSFQTANSHYFDIILDSNNNILKEKNIKSVYPRVDKQKYISILDNDIDLKHGSTVFFGNKYRFFAKNTSANTLIIKERNTVND